MGIIKFLISRHFWISVLVAVLLLFFAVWATMRGLKDYTHWGESVTVPDLRDMTIEQVKERLLTLKLTDTILDSTYVVGKKPDIVLDQNPEPGAKVKENRKIYLTVNSTLPPKVKMPDLIDKQLRVAQLMLQSAGLVAGEISYRPDLAKNNVLVQMLNGKPVDPGKLVPKGSKIDLVLGDGLGETKTEVPNLIGRTLSQAKWVLLSYNLNVGYIEWDKTVTDSASAVVYKQSPDYDVQDPQELNYGEAVDVYLTQRLPDFLIQFSADTTDTP